MTSVAIELLNRFLDAVDLAFNFLLIIDRGTRCPLRPDVLGGW